jgi:hypothetical protein
MEERRGKVTRGRQAGHKGADYATTSQRLPARTSMAAFISYFQPWAASCFAVANTWQQGGGGQRWEMEHVGVLP